MPVQYTATVEVKLPQLVHCAHCDVKFVYEMKVTGVGCDVTGLFQNETATRTSARELARASLKRQLNDLPLCEAVPCPKCFRYQPHMQRAAAREQFMDFRPLALPLSVLCTAFIGVAIISALIYPDLESAALIAGAVSVGVWLLGSGVLAVLNLRVTRYDPNTQELSQREWRAGKRAIPLDDFDAAQAKSLRKEYRKYADAVRVPKWGGSSFEVPDPLVVGWWFTSSIMLNGGSIVIDLLDGESVTVHVPEDCPPGEVLDIHPSSPNVLPFQIRVQALPTHPDEQRLE